MQAAVAIIAQCFAIKWHLSALVGQSVSVYRLLGWQRFATSKASQLGKAATETTLKTTAARAGWLR